MAQVRRVRRIIRKFDPWTVLKVSLLFHFVVTIGLILGLVILWSVILNVGIPQSLDSFFENITLLDPDLSFFNNGQQYFRVVIFLGMIWTVAMTTATTLGAILYNLISDVVGGVEVVMLEESLRIPPPVAGTPTVRTPRTWGAPDPMHADIPTEAQPVVRMDVPPPPPAAEPDDTHEMAMEGVDDVAQVSTND
ncbi:MAG: DUF3566 domain-containing protein [Acidimicrobiia bacterium]|nr:DUF3566 domain-containing protein [Acidimicrobiia bacterium]